MVSFAMKIYISMVHLLWLISESITLLTKTIFLYFLSFSFLGLFFLIESIYYKHFKSSLYIITTCLLLDNMLCKYPLPFIFNSFFDEQSYKF